MFGSYLRMDIVSYLTKSLYDGSIYCEFTRNTDIRSYDVYFKCMVCRVSGLFPDTTARMATFPQGLQPQLKGVDF